MTEPVKQRLVLKVNGSQFEGFESGSVQLTMEDPTNSFDLQYIADGKKPGQRAIFAGDECELLIDAGSGNLESLIKGYVDTADDEDAPDLIRLRVTGRSKTADLEDSAAKVGPGRWTDQKLSKIVKDIASVYGVKVVIDGDEGEAFKAFSIQKGETAFEAIQRAAARRALTCYAVAGDLVLSTAGSTWAHPGLERGVNVVRSARSDSWYGRYSDYIFYGQTRGTDGNSGKNASQIKATSKDSTITRKRVLVVQADCNNKEDLQLLADLECSRRAGQGEVVTAVVDGWGMDSGSAWRPNTLVKFKNDVLGVDAQLIVARVRFEFGPDTPREAELTLMRPEAFLPEKPYPVTKRGKSMQ